eukprot:gene27111-63647_t
MEEWMQASQQIGWSDYYPSAMPSEGAQRWREDEWWRPATRLLPASDLLGLAGARGALVATEAEVDGLARIFGNSKGDRKGREWKFTVPDVDVKILCVAIANIVKGVQDGRDERTRQEAQREECAAQAEATGRNPLMSLRLLAELAREDGNPLRVTAAKRPMSTGRGGAEQPDDDAEADDDGRGRGRYDREHWTPLLNLFAGEVEPVTNRARRAPGAGDLARQSHTVHVGQLPLYVNEQELRKVFAKCGEVSSVTLPTFHPARPPPNMAMRRLPPPPPAADGEEPRRPNKGFAYIQFTDEAGAQKALALDSYPLQGKALKVSPRHTELVGSLAVEHGRRFYLSRCEAPKYRDDRAW